MDIPFVLEDKKDAKQLLNSITTNLIGGSVNDIIFNHKWAKAYWGEHYLTHLYKLVTLKTEKEQLAYIKRT